MYVGHGEHDRSCFYPHLVITSRLSENWMGTYLSSLKASERHSFIALFQPYTVLLDDVDLIGTRDQTLDASSDVDSHCCYDSFKSMNRMTNRHWS